jgi:hypothetical protein
MVNFIPIFTAASTLLYALSTTLALTLPDSAEVLLKRTGSIANCGGLGGKMAIQCPGGSVGGVYCECGIGRTYTCRTATEPRPDLTASCKAKGCGCTASGP